MTEKKQLRFCVFNYSGRNHGPEKLNLFFSFKSGLTSHYQQVQIFLFSWFHGIRSWTSSWQPWGAACVRCRWSSSSWPWRTSCTCGSWLRDIRRGRKSSSGCGRPLCRTAHTRCGFCCGVYQMNWFPLSGKKRMIGGKIGILEQGTSQPDNIHQIFSWNFVANLSQIRWCKKHMHLKLARLICDKLRVSRGKISMT